MCGKNKGLALGSLVLGTSFVSFRVDKFLQKPNSFQSFKNTLNKIQRHKYFLFLYTFGCYYYYFTPKVGLVK